jgi:hypothetical protein
MIQDKQLDDEEDQSDLKQEVKIEQLDMEYQIEV